MKRLAPWLAPALAALVVRTAVGSQTVSWRTVGADEFRRARIDSLIVDPDGRVVLAPANSEIARWDDAGAWSLTVTKGGEWYVGTGDEGKVYHADPSGRSELVAGLPEIEVHALAALPDGRVLAGTSPEGKVYAIAKGKSPEVVFDPEDRYIWAILPLPGGEFLVATGDKARLYRVDRSGKGTILYENPDPHIRSLAVGRDGIIYLGTSGRGLLIRLEKDGKARVLVDSKRQEIVSIALDAAGGLYAAAVGDQPTSLSVEAAAATITVTAEAPPPEEPRIEPPGSRPEGRTQGAGAAPVHAEPPAPPPPPGAEVWRVDPDGFARTIWTTRIETVYALSADGGRGVYAGTGPEGSLYRIEPDGRASWFGKYEGGPISALAAFEGRLLILGAAPARLRGLGPALAESGTIESHVFDARVFSLWGSLRWVLEPPRAGGVSMSVRSGNTEDPDATWSEWTVSAAAGDPSEGAPVAAPPGRFVQWRASFARVTSGAQPVLSEVELRFRPRNVAPRIETITILPAGVAFQVQPSGGQPGSEAPFLSNPYADDVLRFLAGGHRAIPNYRRFYLAGARTVTWEGSDENGDDLSFDVLISGRDESRWRPVARRVVDGFLTWDSRGFEDGWYRLQVIGSDAPENPEEETRTGEKMSEPFVIDNTPPRIDELTMKRRDRKAVISFRVSDTAGRISFAEYALDAGAWRILLPEDRVEDSKVETYRFEIEMPDDGEHVAVVRAADEGGNWVSRQVVVKK